MEMDATNYAKSPADIKATAEMIAATYSFNEAILAGAICSALVMERERCAKIAGEKSRLNSEMVGRVKAALLKKASEVNIRDFPEAFARAAIEAMMEPTPETIAAIRAVVLKQTKGFHLSDAFAAEVWREALSPSLKEQDRTP